MAELAADEDSDDDFDGRVMIITVDKFVMFMVEMWGVWTIFDFEPKLLTRVNCGDVAQARVQSQLNNNEEL